MRVLMRAWPNRADSGVSAVQAIVEMEDDTVLNDGDLCFIRELNDTVPVHHRPAEAAEGADMELRFELTPKQVSHLRYQGGWKPFTDPACTDCVHR